MATTSAAEREPLPSPAVDSNGYRTSPDQETRAWPPGVPFIIGNEACERFSFYGMKAKLYEHLTILYAANLALASYPSEGLKQHAENLATSTNHLFIAGVYALPMIGAILADRLLGKYKTIFYLSLVYCAGHAALAFGETTLFGMYIGLSLISIGSGGIKPCVSANVGDQFGKGNWFRVRTIYQIFYFSINFGSFFSQLLIPYLYDEYGASVAFGVPGVLMFIATVCFWMGRKTYVHVPPRPGGKLGVLDALSSIFLFLSIGHLFYTAGQPAYVILGVSVLCLAIGLGFFNYRQSLKPDQGFLAIMVYTLKCWLGLKSENGGPPASSDGQDGPLSKSAFWSPAVARFGHAAAEGPVAVLKIISVFFLVSVFWALFDQHSSSWIRQAQQMNLEMDLPWGKKAMKPSQIQALNGLFVMLLIPIMNVLYGLLERLGIPMSPLRRITVGMFMTALSFVAVALIQWQIDNSEPKSVWFVWQVIPYLVITIGEVMVSITGLEFAYTQAPKAMKSTIMGFWLLTVALGNVLVAVLARFGGLPLIDFFWVFAGLMAGAGVLFGIRAYFYVQRDYTQE